MFLQNLSLRRSLSEKIRHFSSLDLSGVFPPIVTPFDSKNQISYEDLEKNFKIWNKIPFRGFVVLGSNGEAVSLSKTEKISLIQAAKNLAKTNSLIIAGLGCHGASETIELINEVNEKKIADAALIITPSFYKGQMTDESLAKYYEEVSDKSPLPIILYSVPSNTNIDMNPQLVSSLANHPNIIGLKDSGGDIAKISRIVHETRGKNFQVLAGSAGFLLPGLLMGCVGTVSALGNVLGASLCQLFNFYQNGDLVKAVELQRRLILPNSLVTREFGVAGLKYAMSWHGLSGGNCRSPLIALNPAQIQLLEKVFEKEGFMPPKK